jgi:hypothetical protein
MRIALVAQNGSPLTPATGQEPMSQAASVAAHARGLAKLGHRVTIYARRDARALPGSAIIAPRVTVEHVTAGPAAPLSGAELAANIAEFSDQLVQRWRKNPPSLVHSFFWTSGLAALAAARGHDIPLVQTFGTLGVAERRHGSPTDGNDVRIRLEACLARSAHAVLASTATEAADLLNMGVPRASVTVVPCGVDTAEFAPEGPVASAAAVRACLRSAAWTSARASTRCCTCSPGCPAPNWSSLAARPGAAPQDETYRALTSLAGASASDRLSVEATTARRACPPCFGPRTCW